MKSYIMIMKKITFLILSFLLLLNSGMIDAQKRDKTTKARAAFEAGEYTLAVDLLKDAYNKISDKEVKNELIFLIAECYRVSNAPEKAELWYKKSIQKEYQNPTVYLRYADALRMNEEYDDALEQYRKYKELVPDDPRGQNGITSCELALQWMNNRSGYQVENMKYFNSRQSDFAPFFASDDYKIVYFTSSREGATGNDIHGATGENFADIFQSMCRMSWPGR